MGPGHLDHVVANVWAANGRERKVTPRFAGPPLGLQGHEGDLGVTEYLVRMTGSQGQVWDGDLVLKPQDCVSEVVGRESAAVGMDLGILKWD